MMNVRKEGRQTSSKGVVSVVRVGLVVCSLSSADDAVVRSERCGSRPVSSDRWGVSCGGARGGARDSARLFSVSSSFGSITTQYFCDHCSLRVASFVSMAYYT